MKKLLFLLAIFCTLEANAQPYSISFAGTGLSTVKVQNLTTGVIVDVPAGDVLHLSTLTGIPEVNNMKGSGLKVYPNPMTDKSTLEIHPPVAGDAIISVCDMTGKVLTQFKGYVENYKQEFSLSGIKNGLHIINVQGNGYQFSEKLLSNGKSNGTAIIARESNNTHAVNEKKTIEDSKGVQANVDMAYNSGERLIYTAVSGNDRTVMTVIPSADKTVPFTFTECKDGDNNYYPVVQINTQLWMAENLKTTNCSNGTPIPLVNNTTSWDTLTATGKAYCWYNDNIANKATYGALYTWAAAMNGAAGTNNNPSGIQGVCPTGWHLPSDAEWTQMENYLADNGYNYDGTTGGGSAKIAKSLASTSGWNSSSNTGAVGNTDYPAYRNKSGFTAIPGGFRSIAGSYSIGDFGYWWSAKGSTSTAYYRSMGYDYSSETSEDNITSKECGFSVRCIKD